uniref:Uncharacterized protein n=1 Tax=Romanomermis culicivorax TaxID=13658 RepID=A0A915JEZ2_ROMCU
MNGTLLRLLIGSSGQLDIETSDGADLKFTFDTEKITMSLNQHPSSDVVKTAIDISNVWERMDERLDVIEEDEEEEKAWAEYRKQMDFLEDLLSLRPE